MFFSVIRGYNALLAKYPCTTKTVTAGALAAAGDVFVQINSKEDGEKESSGGIVKRATAGDRQADPLQTTVSYETFDVKRFVGFTIFGSIWSGYLNHYWFDWLAKTFAHHTPVKALAYKTLCQHGLLNPFLYIPAFFLSQGWWLGKSWEETKETASRSYVATLSSCYLFWIPATSAQFLWIPLRYQVLYGSTLSFFWNVFLALQD